jgi:NADH-quinone oxidoreductase subunit N
LFGYAPGLAVAGTIFFASLAGIPPLGGWIAKFAAFKAVLNAGTGWAVTLAIIGAVNSVIAFGYYGNILREIWMKPVPDGDETPIRVPSSLLAALTLTSAATIILGVLPQTVLRLGDLSSLLGGLGG